MPDGIAQFGVIGGEGFESIRSALKEPVIG